MISAQKYGHQMTLKTYQRNPRKSKCFVATMLMGCHQYYVLEALHPGYLWCARATRAPGCLARQPSANTIFHTGSQNKCRRERGCEIGFFHSRKKESIHGE